jgi:hypothetical protein
MLGVHFTDFVGWAANNKEQGEIARSHKGLLAKQSQQVLCVQQADLLTLPICRVRR